VAEWGAEGRHWAHLGLLLDYGCMLGYGLFFALAGFAIRDTARERGWRLRSAGTGAASMCFADSLFCSERVCRSQGAR